MNKCVSTTTDMEIKASEAERASIKYKQVQFLQDKKSIVFNGIISGVTEWGFYVELTENKCEALFVFVISEMIFMNWMKKITA